MTNENQSTSEVPPMSAESLAQLKAILKNVDWLSYKGNASVIQFSTLGRMLQKFVRNMDPQRPTFLKLRNNQEIVFLTVDQYISILRCKRRLEQIVAREEQRIITTKE